jgi:hypothetical protein
MQEPSIIAKNVVAIMDIFLRMGQTQLVKDTAIMVFVWFLNPKAK